MRTLALGLLMAMSAASICQKKDDGTPPPVTPNGAPSASTGQPPYPPQPGASGAPQQPQPPPGYAGQPVPPGTPQPLTPSGSPMSIPGPAAFPCSNDTACGLAHCNTQYGKCVFPCVNADVDCIQGAACIVGFCVPKPPGQ